jgi:hypothetical protein
MKDATGPQAAPITANASSMCFLGLNCEENTLRTTPSGSITQVAGSGFVRLPVGVGGLALCRG